MALARRVPDDASVTSEAYKAGEAIGEEELAALSDDDLDRMAGKYLQGDDGQFMREAGEEATSPDELSSERLRRLALSSMAMTEESSRKLAEKFGSFKLSPGLHKSIMQTATIANGLGQLLPHGLLGDLSKISAFSKLGEALGADSAAMAVVRPVDRPLLSALRPPPNPIHQTNNLLEGVSEGIGRLTEDIGKMVAISEMQAALIQSLSETATLALVEAASSSQKAEKSAELAERSTRLTKYGVWAAIAAICVSAAVSGFAIRDQERLSDETDHRLLGLIDAVKESTQASLKLQTDISQQAKTSLDAQTRALLDAHVASTRSLEAAIERLKLSSSSPKGAVGASTARRN